MANRWAGEVPVSVNGVAVPAKLTLGALAELESELATGSLVELAERFETGRFSARDVVAVLVAGLRGGGWSGDAQELAVAEVGGGPMGAVRCAAELLARAFAVAGDRQ